jgi:hypothetical protein
MRAAEVENMIKWSAVPASRDPSVTVLREVVAGLAERIDLLEARERLTRSALSPGRSRRRKSA